MKRRGRNQAPILIDDDSDLFHLKENIYTYAKYKFSHNEKEYVPWAEFLIEKVENIFAGTPAM